MKIRLSLLAIAILSVYSTFAQTPHKMSYQAILRNTSDNLIINTLVGMKVSILKGSSTGIAVYEETHSPSTNSNGLVSIEIGAGNITSGSFSSINWGNDSYFIKTETDPTGGSNYTITGTSQLLSVPYALYAENTKSTGKVSIYLNGTITDQQAAQKLSEELGPNTENIYITDTYALTSVTINTNRLVKLIITNNNALVSINADTIQQVDDVIKINQNPSLVTLQFNLLKNSQGLTITNNNSLATLDFPNLNISPIEISTNPQLQTVNLSDLQYTNPGNLFITSNPTLTTVNSPNLLISSTYIINNQSLTTFNLTNFSSGVLDFYQNSALQTLNFPNFISGNVKIHKNQSLISISIPNLTQLITFSPGSYSFDLSENKLSSNSINSILHQLATLATSATPLTGQIISLREQSPVAPPTGLGITDKNTLISNGNTVYTD